MPQNTTMTTIKKYLQCKLESQTTIAKWLVFKGETLNNDILLQIYLSVPKLSKLGL